MYNPQLETFIRVAEAGSFNKAAVSLYRDTKYIISTAKILVELWPQSHALCPGIKFQLVPFENTPENARAIAFIHENAWAGGKTDGCHGKHLL